MQHIGNEIQLEIELRECKQTSKPISRFLCKNVYTMLLFCIPHVTHIKTKH